MGRVFVVDLDNDDPEALILACRKCKTHIARRRDFINHFMRGNFHDMPTQPWLIVSNAFNVQVDRPELDHEMSIYDLSLTVAYVHCVKCGDMLGEKVVKHEGYERGKDQINHAGRFFLIMGKHEMRGANGVHQNVT